MVQESASRFGKSHTSDIWVKGGNSATRTPIFCGFVKIEGLYEGDTEHQNYEKYIERWGPKDVFQYFEKKVEIQVKARAQLDHLVDICREVWIRDNNLYNKFQGCFKTTSKHHVQSIIRARSNQNHRALLLGPSACSRKKAVEKLVVTVNFWRSKYWENWPEVAVEQHDEGTESLYSESESECESV
jgi:hypothetical protein